MLEYEKDNDTQTRDGLACMEDTTETELVLTLMADAFRRFIKPCSVLVNTECGLIHSAMKKNENGESWLEQWEKNGWRRARGLELKHAALWRELSERMGRHHVRVEKGDNSYKAVYQKAINGELAKEHREGMELKRDIYKII